LETSPLVSLITPTLNPGERLLRCLDNIASQTYAHIEHIVVDGGSRDGTLEVLTERGAQFISEPDEGQTDALNKGFDLATGDYLGWLNADDLLGARAVEQAVAAFATARDIGWVYGDCEHRQGDKLVWFMRSPRHMRRHTLDNGNTVAQQGSLFARWALDRVGKLDETFHLAMDYDLWLRLVDAGVAAACVPETLAVMEIHDTSKTGSIHRSEFLREEGTALLKSGRRRAAAMALGRAAASAAQSEAGLVEPERVRAEVERFTTEAAERGLGEEDEALKSAAYAQAAVLELQVSVRGFRHLARRQPWRYAQTRRYIATRSWQGAPMLVRRLASGRSGDS
jgi:hypothetical protein